MLSMVVALVKELGQIFVPLRFFGLDDLLVDGLSSLLAAITILAFKCRPKMI